ncbi:hypothetical protein Hte_011588 [Hypoxylon texense]
MVENVAIRTEILNPMPRRPGVDPDLEMDLESLTNLPNLACACWTLLRKTHSWERQMPVLSGDEARADTD